MVSIEELIDELEGLLELSEALLSECREGNWQAVESLEQHRQQRQAALTKKGIPKTLPDELRSTLNTLTQLNREIASELNNAKGKTASALRTARTGSSAVKSYASTGKL